MRRQLSPSCGSTSPSESGFNLAELMIVVVILGLLATIGGAAFSRYVKKARTAEVPSYMSTIVAGATAYYETDHVDGNGVVLERQFPDRTTKEKRCCLYKEHTGICPGGASQYQTVEWKALNFRIGDPHYFRPDFYPAGSGRTASFAIEVYGDQDCDEDWSTFRITGGIDSSGNVYKSGGMFIINELE